jgi:hypothetical protein
MGSWWYFISCFFSSLRHLLLWSQNSDTVGDV